MKLVVLSDTHRTHLPKEKLSGDLLIHAGDFYDASDKSDRDLRFLNEWFAEQDFGVKIYVPGNHDYPVWSSWYKGDGKLSEATLLVDESMEHGGFKFFGSPWTSNCGMAFPSYWDEIHTKWAAIPKETDILITHMPPFLILDDGVRIDGLGCPELRKRVFKIKPKLHVFGHVHASRGMRKLGKTVYINASQCYGAEAAGTFEFLV